MIENIDHIGIAVRDLRKGVENYGAILGLECREIEEIEEQKVRVAILPVDNVNIELLESTHTEGPIARFIERKGEGFHHIAYRVKNIGEELGRLKKMNVKLIDEEPRRGAHGSKIAFVHPKSTGGILVELVERE